MAFAYAVFAQFLSLEVAALLEKKTFFFIFCVVPNLPYTRIAVEPGQQKLRKCSLQHPGEGTG